MTNTSLVTSIASNATNTSLVTTSIASNATNTSLVTTSIASNGTNVTGVVAASDAVAYLWEYVKSEALNPWVVVGVVVSVLLLAIGVFVTVHFVRMKRLEHSYQTTTMLMGSASWAPPLVPLPPRPRMPNSASVRNGGGRNVKI